MSDILMSLMPDGRAAGTTEARPTFPVSCYRRKTSMTFFGRLLAACLLVAGLSACETIKGAGQDIENIGEEIDEEI
ncbi:hypothetical protein [Parvularcula lutaonensis]|uniref:Entericidin A/B family lipoprotein n=1 Tax=Parvularcula lutaonensis TaxID=491923 RepID=A0ABV7MCW6_9PROT|nr:hypothetical protein [Parvularcula lutaonensis]